MSEFFNEIIGGKGSGNSGGNVSGSGSSVIGQPAIFGDTTRTTIISPTNTAAQRQIYSKAQNIIVSYTTAERNSLSWSSGDIILNSTTLLLEQYNGTTWYTVYQDNSDFVNWIENGVNGGGTLAGSTYWQTNSSVSLKNCVTFTNTSSTFQTGVWYKNIPQVAQYKRIVLQADHVAGGGTGADGIWYSLFANSTSYSNKELTQNNSYTVYFDEFNNTVKLYYNGTLLQSTNINNLQTGIGQSKQIKFIVDYNYLTNTSIIFVNIIGSDIGTGACIQYTDSTQRDLSGQYVLVGGRTGGSTNFHEIHYLSIRKFYGY